MDMWEYLEWWNMCNPTEPSRSKLLAELVELAKHGIERAFKGLNGNNPPDLTELSLLAKRLHHEDWQTDRVMALRLIMQNASRKLIDEPEPVNSHTVLTWFTFAWTVYNLDNEDLEHIDGNRYSYLLDEVLRKNNIAISLAAKKRLTSALRKKLADALLKMYQNSLLSQSPDTDTERVGESRTLPGVDEKQLQRIAPKYVPRPNIVERFEQGLQKGYQLFVLCGEPGTGKSEAAKDLARRLTWPATDFVFIRAHNDRILIQDIVRYLSRVQPEVKQYNDAAVIELFKEVIENATSGIVVIDNITNVQQIQEILPSSLNGLVLLLTTRKMLDHDRLPVFALLIENLEKRQAVAMIQKRIPTASIGDAEFLADELHGRPLAIEHSCTYLNKVDHSLTIKQFCTALRSDIATALDSIGPINEPTLTAIYKKILSELEPYSSANDLLMLVLLTGPLMVDVQSARLLWVNFDDAELASENVTKDDWMTGLSRRYFFEAVHAGLEIVKPARSSIRATIMADRAIELLTNWGLVSIESDGIINIHEMTASICVGLSRPKLETMAWRVLDITMNLLRRMGWQPGENICESALEWASAPSAAYHLLGDKIIESEIASQQYSSGWIVAFLLRFGCQDGNSVISYSSLALHVWRRFWNVGLVSENDNLREALSVLAREIYASLQVESYTRFAEIPVKGLSDYIPERDLVELDMGDSWSPRIRNKESFDRFATLHLQRVEAAANSEDLIDLAREQYRLGTVLFDFGRFGDANEPWCHRVSAPPRMIRS